LIAHEAPLTGGFAAEISSTVQVILIYLPQLLLGVNMVFLMLDRFKLDLDFELEKKLFDPQISAIH